MFSIMLLIAAFQTGDGLTILGTVAVLAFVWTMIISEIRKSAEKKNTRTETQNPIDRHMDENYADIDWLRKGKL